MPEPKPEPELPKSKGRGRGGRGRKPAKGVGKGEDKGKEKEKGAKPVTKVLFLLTNLVRTGNQMSNAGSWRIVQQALQRIISERLEICPLTTLPADAEAQLELNRTVLIMLNKLSGPGTAVPSRIMSDSATELLQFLRLVSDFPPNLEHCSILQYQCFRLI